MKKIIGALILLLAFSINANAQSKKSQTASDKAKKETAELTQYLSLDQTTSDNFYRLFEQKESVLETKDISAERRAELSRVIEAKIRATLDAKQTERLEKNPELFNRLIN